MVDYIYEKLCLFLSKLLEAEPHSSALGKVVKGAWGLIQNTETKVNIKFLVAFGEYYWTPGYNWLLKKYLIKRLDAHSSHEVIVQVSTMQNKIQSLINDGWQTNKIFQDCYTNLMRLSHDEYHISKGTMLLQKSTSNKPNGFLYRYL